MDAFSYLSVLISIILGLGITQLLTALGRLLNSRARVRWYWPAVVWAGILLVVHIQSWWAMFGLRTHENWTFLAFLVVLLLPILLYLAAALALGACGASSSSSSSSKFKGEQGQVAKVVSDLADAGRRKDAAKICSTILSSDLVAQIKSAGGDCEQEMKKVIDDADDYDLEVQTVRIEGNQAQARVRQGKKGPLTTFSFVRESGGWRATSLG
jgi:hypothetical protein